MKLAKRPFSCIMFGEPFRTTLDNAIIGYRKAWMLDNYVLGHDDQIRSDYTIILCKCICPNSIDIYLKFSDIWATLS